MSLIPDIVRDLSWTIAIAELKSIGLSAVIETANTMRTTETEVMTRNCNKLLVGTRWIFSLTETTAIVIVQSWQCLSCWSFLSISVKAWIYCWKINSSIADLSEHGGNLGRVTDVAFYAINQWSVFYLKTLFLLIEEIIIFSKNYRVLL